MSIKEKDKISKKETVLMWVQYFKVGIMTTLILLLVVVSFKVGEINLCNNSNGTLINGQCSNIIDVGVVRICQENPLQEAVICSRAKVDKPNEFCQQYGEFIETEQ